jgi:hypothetical protein
MTYAAQWDSNIARNHYKVGTTVSALSGHYQEELILCLHLRLDEARSISLCQYWRTLPLALVNP